MAVSHLIDLDDLDELNQYHSDDHILEEIIAKIDSRSTSTLVELTAGDTCSGKSALIYLLVAVAVLPIQFNDRKLGGKNGIAVVFDTDDSFDASMLHRTMRHLMLGTDPGREELQTNPDTDRDPEMIQGHTHKDIASEQTIEALCSDALKNVHIFRPPTFQSLFATLDKLPQYLLQLQVTRPVQTIIIDSASAFYWQIRAEQETRRIQALEDKASPSTPAPSYLLLVQKLRELSQQFECGIIATTWDLAPSSQPLTSKLNPTLPVTANVRLEVYRVPIKHFAGHSSIELAQRQKIERIEAACRHQFEVSNGREVVRFNMRAGVVAMSEGQSS